MSGANEPGKFNIVLRGEATARTFDIAQGPEGEYIYEIVGVGRELKESWDFRAPSDGLGEVTRYSPTSNGEYFTNNIDTSARGLRMSPSIGQSSNADITLTAVTGVSQIQYFEEIDASSNRYTYIHCVKDTTTDPPTTLRVIKINNSTNAIVAAATEDFTYTGHVYLRPGRPERWGAFTYICANSPTADIDAMVQLNNCTTSGADVWTRINSAVNVHGLLREESGAGAGTTTGAVNRLLRGINANQIQSNSVATTGTAGVPVQDGPLANANWAPSPGHEVGSAGGIMTGGASYAGYTFIAKTDGLYAFDADGNSYSVITFVSRSANDTNNGYGTTAYGDRCFYPCENGFWRILDITRAALMGPDSIPGYTRMTGLGSSAAPIRGRHFEVTSYGKWIYCLYYGPGDTSYVLAATIERHPQTGFEMKWYSLIFRDSETLRGIFVDSRRQLRFCGSVSGSLTAQEHRIQLAQDGAPDVTTTGRGAPSATHIWFGPEVDFGERETLKQLRWAFVEVESGVATAAWRVGQYRDSRTVELIASSFDGVSVGQTSPVSVNWTVGTTDTCYRFRPEIRCVTTAGYDETATIDPKILSLVIHARTADVWRVVLTESSQANLFDVGKLLRQQKNAGPVTIREPGTNETHTAYVKQVNDILYATSTGQSRGLEIVYERFSAAA